MTPDKPSLLSGQLMLTAERRLENPTSLTPADLRRATSDIYYALFHKVCEALVIPIGSDPESKAFRDTYITLYRLPDHAYLEQKCKEVRSHAFSDAVKHFAAQLVTFKNKRQIADYDPIAKFEISIVKNDWSIANSVLTDFNSVTPEEQARFAFFVALRGRRPEGKGEN